MQITTSVLENVREANKKYSMFNNGDTIVLGVSGGADSVMLLHVFKSLQTEYDLTLKVAHINHKIRAGAAEQDASFVQNLCEKWDIPFFLKEAFIPQLAKEWSVGEEEAGRMVRYGFFSELAGEAGKIATAHNANDDVETVLMRFMRGTGVAGLAGISFKHDNIIRPILGITRETIEQYLQENDLVHITDKTNFEPIYTRNKIRLSLIPYMQNTFNPNLIKTVTNNINTYKEDADYFDVVSSDSFNSICKCYEDGSCTVTCNKLALSELHVAIAKRVIIKAIRTVKGVEQIDVRPTVLANVLALTTKNVGATVALNDGFQVRVQYDLLVFEKCLEDKVEFTPTVVRNEVTSVVPFNELGYELHIRPVKMVNVVNTASVCYIPKELYENNIFVLRCREGGDVFRIDDNSHKNLSRIMCDKKVPAVKRDTIPLLCCGSQVYWVVGEFVTRFRERGGEFIRLEWCRIEDKQSNAI